jgi:hypothetical protein
MSVISETGLPWLSLSEHHAMTADSPSVAEVRWTRRLIGTASGICFVLAWMRYAFFRAEVCDLGYFDQAVYLISRGKPAFIPLLGYPIFADHGAYVLYPLALLYVIYPSVLWLFAVQAAALGGGAWFVWRLARQAGVLPRWAMIVCGAWLVYPAVGVLNLQDFHPEILAVPALLGAVLYCRERRPVAFLMCLIVALGASEVVTLTVAAMGLWLFLSEKNRSYGLAALLMAACWFVVVTHIIMLLGQGRQSNGIFFSSPGGTDGEPLRMMLAHPLTQLRWVVSNASAIYLLFLIAPIWWGLRPAHLAPLLCAAPCVAVTNCLA